MTGFGAMVLLLLPARWPVQVWLTDLVNLTLAVLAADCAARRAARSAGRLRRSWRALAAGCAAWSVGQLLWIAMTWTGHHPFPSVADPLFLLFPPLAGLALLLRPSDDAARPLGRVLDAAITTLALGLIGWRVTAGAIRSVAISQDALTAATAVGYAALDVLLAVLAVLSLARSPAGRLPLVLITGGLLAFVVTDIGFAARLAAGGTPPVPMDLGWSLGFAGIALAALLRSAPERADRPGSFPPIGLLPCVPVVVALLLAASAPMVGAPMAPGELVLAGALVILTMTRQYVALRHNWRLTEQLAQREEQLRIQAFHDGLTGLANRALFRDRLEHAVDLHARDLRPVSLLFLDLDDFKEVNDTLGHAAGDQLLIRVAERLRGLTRTGDTVARLGGDEFAVLLEDGADPFASAQRIIDTLRNPFDLGHQHVNAAVSVGVVELTPADARIRAEDLLARADTAMYAAKRAGKDRIVGHTAGMSQVEEEEQRLRTVLERAVTDGAIRLAYQPIIDLDTGRTVALEALARWQHEDADVPPTTFLTAAARTAVLPDLINALLVEACGQLAEWSTGWPRGTPPLSVHVNVTPAQLGADGFAGTVAGLVARHRLRRGQLVMEITEAGAVADLAGTLPVLAELRAAGVAVSLDDFGVGYSSLTRLTEIELDSVKIARSFLHRIDSDQRQAAFLRCLLGLARDIRLPVIAEGVERPGQRDALRQLGCRYAQGYLLGRPAFADATTARLGLTRTASSA